MVPNLQILALTFQTYAIQGARGPFIWILSEMAVSFACGLHIPFYFFLYKGLLIAFLSNLTFISSQIFLSELLSISTRSW